MIEQVLCAILAKLLEWAIKEAYWRWGHRGECLICEDSFDPEILTTATIGQGYCCNHCKNGIWRLTHPKAEIYRI